MTPLLGSTSTADEPRLRVAVLADGFITWGGGIDFLRLIIRGLQACSAIGRDDIHVFCSREFRWRSRLSMATYELLRSVWRRLRSRPSPSKSYLTVQVLQDAFGDLVPAECLHIYDGSFGGLLRLVKRHRLAVILPAWDVLPPRFPVPWIGYLYDFQHKHLPNYFSPEERQRRDKEFALMLHSAPVVMVNSRAAEADCLKFLQPRHARIVALPFSPLLPMDPADVPATAESQAKYSVGPRYFMISNQAWVHKNHITAIKAFGMAFKEEPGVELVCTGDAHDPRAPNILQTLASTAREHGVGNRVRFLGRIPKPDQMSLMRGAVAVVQPTLFEGGPGGGQVYEAVALGVPVLLSDIPVNREVNDGDVRFFEPFDVSGLATLMTNILRSESSSSRSDADLSRRSFARQQALGASLLEAARLARSVFHPYFVADSGVASTFSRRGPD